MGMTIGPWTRNVKGLSENFWKITLPPGCYRVVDHPSGSSSGSSSGSTPVATVHDCRQSQSHVTSAVPSPRSVNVTTTAVCPLCAQYGIRSTYVCDFPSIVIFLSLRAHCWTLSPMQRLLHPCTVVPTRQTGQVKLARYFKPCPWLRAHQR